MAGSHVPAKMIRFLRPALLVGNRSSKKSYISLIGHLDILGDVEATVPKKKQESAHLVYIRTL